MSDLLSLISRLEAAKEGSREADAEIEISRRRFLFGAAAVAGMSIQPDGWIVGGDSPNPIKAPAYTSSVDAALSHEAEGFWEIYGPYKYPPAPNRWRAVFWYGPERAHVPYQGWGATEALARRIASLRARAT
jgi:hypothetical protein